MSAAKALCDSQRFLRNVEKSFVRVLCAVVVYLKFTHSSYATNTILGGFGILGQQTRRLRIGAKNKYLMLIIYIILLSTSFRGCEATKNVELASFNEKILKAPAFHWQPKTASSQCFLSFSVKKQRLNVPQFRWNEKHKKWAVAGWRNVWPFFVNCEEKRQKQVAEPNELI